MVPVGEVTQGFEDDLGGTWSLRDGEQMTPIDPVGHGAEALGQPQLLRMARVVAGVEHKARSGWDGCA